ncbi:BspA family leucine-rich repeat surface protein [Listeria monocytogenes]|uniref:BspA family leucine-rich repeat surface protein n=2 Tax=Listeria monocytogenes TaxID=1639 RepID=UPI0011EB55B5|nr:BspA family leucine-rich repeat surface protein [Listeria monocytogenes]TYV60093.1 BspA family leucine-rich repeat surface protein [Listeria monocytogenes]
MKKRKKRLKQLVVALLVLCTIGLPMQNIVLANELSTTEEVITEETESATTAEADTSNSENMENEISTADEAESVILDESTQTSKEISSSETVLEKRGILTDTSDVNSSEKTEASSANQQSEERSSTKAITSGTFPNSSTATWNFDDTTGTLTISAGTLVDPVEYWDGSCYLETLTGVAGYEITNVVLEGKVFASGNCDGLFSLLTARSPSLDLSNFDTSNVTSMDSMFYANYAASIDVSNWDTSQVTNMFCMFAESAATSLDLSSFDTSKVWSMAGMFAESAATSLDVSSFDTSNVTEMADMFSGSAATSLDVSNFDTSNVTSMSVMFACSAATSLDLSNFDTSNVRDMYYMFNDSAATSLDLSSFDTSNVTSMGFMFESSAVTSLNLSNFDTSNVTDMRNLFVGASQLQNLTLGSQVQFLGVGAFLPDPTPTAKYTGKWQNVGSGTVDKPKGSFVGTGMELISMYDGSTMADTYVWQPTLLEVNVQDSILMIGDTWNPEDNFLDATDTAGNPVDVNAITVTGSVDTTQPGVYTVTYSYGGITSTATITVLEMMPASWINFFVDGTNIRSIPGSLLSIPEWDLTTGLWTGWNPGAIKVPTDKIPLEPIKQGYVFKGWKDNTGKIVDFKTLDLDLNSQNEFNFYAVFEKVNSTNPSVEPPAKPGEGPNVVSPSTPGSGGNQTLSNGSGSNTGNMTITSLGNTTMTSQGNTATASSVTSSQGGKLAKLGENSSLLLQGFGLMLVLSGTIFFLFKRKNTRY